MSQDIVDVPTPAGPGRITVSRPADVAAGGILVLGHGAGGARWTNDVVAVRDAAVALGWVVALADQPWRVAGKKVATRPPVLDQAWPALVQAARDAADGPGSAALPLVVGGRSAGARVACRTCLQVGAAAVLALSFPLHPPGKPESSRADELRVPVDAGLPVRVIQGLRDPFGHPEEVAAALPGGSGDGVVVSVGGTHSLRDPAAVARLAREWLSGLAPSTGAPATSDR